MLHLFARHSIWNVMCVVAHCVTCNNCHPNNINSYDEQSQKVCPYTKIIFKATALRPHGRVLQNWLFSPRVCQNKGCSWQQVWGAEQGPYIYLERGRLAFSKCPWLLKLLFYGAIIAKVLLWEARIAIIKQVYICLWRRSRKGLIAPILPVLYLVLRLSVFSSPITILTALAFGLCVDDRE